MKRLTPPPLATWLLEHLRLSGSGDALPGDLLEDFGQGRSATWYWRQVLVAIFFNWGSVLRRRITPLGAGNIALAETTNDSLNPAFWLAPLVSTLPLIPFFSLPASALFLGRLEPNPATNPFLHSPWGPWLAAAGVVFDGTILAYIAAVFLYLILFGSGRRRQSFAGEKLPTVRILILFSMAGIAASQLVRVLQNFRQPGLREFAVSWLSPFLGCLCGLIAGACFAFLANRRFSLAARALVYSLPVAIVVACGIFLVWSANMMRAH